MECHSSQDKDKWMPQDEIFSNVKLLQEFKVLNRLHGSEGEPIMPTSKSRKTLPPDIRNDMIEIIQALSENKAN
jgi:hypothetical protein